MKQIIILLIIFSLGCGNKNNQAKSSTSKDKPQTITKTPTQYFGDSIIFYNVDGLIKLAKKEGIQELEKKIYPLDLVYFDYSYAKTIVDLEFESGFWARYVKNESIIEYEKPNLTIELADRFNSKYAAKKLFDYYQELPKLTHSDTFYDIYNDIDSYLKVLVKFDLPELTKKLKTDYEKWCEIAQNSQKKKYLTIDEVVKMSVEEQMQFRPNELIVDANYIALQLAGALKYLNIEGFDDPLIEKLKKQQSYPLANKYEFPISRYNDLKNDYFSTKTIKDTLKITDIKKDYKKLEKLIFDNFNNCCDARAYEVIEAKTKAYISVSRNNGFDEYFIEIKENDSIKIDLKSSILE